MHAEATSCPNWSGFPTPLHMNADMRSNQTNHCAVLARTLTKHPADCHPYLLEAWAADLLHTIATAVMATAMPLTMTTNIQYNVFDIVARPMQQMRDTQASHVDDVVRYQQEQRSVPGCCQLRMPAAPVCAAVPRRAAVLEPTQKQAVTRTLGQTQDLQINPSSRVASMLQPLTQDWIMQ